MIDPLEVEPDQFRDHLVYLFWSRNRLQEEVDAIVREIGAVENRLATIDLELHCPGESEDDGAGHVTVTAV